MIRGYLLALCSGSALDASTKNFTLFNLIENISVPEAGLAQTLPFELHFYCMVEPAARNSEFEMRVVRLDETGRADFGEVLPFRTQEGSHFRIRTMAFRLPKSFGQHALHVEWRRRGESNWNVDPLAWPLAVSPLQPQETQKATR